MSDKDEPRVFINYRTADSGLFAMWLSRELERFLQPGQVFIDRRGIEGGEDWPDRLREEAEKATVMFALIGDGWLHTHDEEGRRRIDQRGDWVRREIAFALDGESGIKLVPIAVDAGTLSIKARDLPKSLKAMPLKWTLPLRRTDFDADLDSLLSVLRDSGFRFQNEASARDVLDPYRAGVRQAHRSLFPLFPGSDASPCLDDVFIDLELELSTDQKQPKTRGTRKEQRNAEPGVERGEDADRAASGEPGSLPSRMNLRALMEFQRSKLWTGRWALLGEPGAGKTTVARHLAWELAGESGDEAPIPVYVSLLRWVLEERLDPFDLAENDLCAACGDGVGSGLAAVLRSNAARVWLLLDGLDEVAPGHLSLVRERVARLAADLPDLTVCVLSRRVGYSDVSDVFRRAGLRKLGPEAQQRLLDGWLGGRSAEVWARIEAHESLLSLCTNPLMLSLIADLALKPGALPTTRIGLYDRAIDSLLRGSFGPDKTAVRDVDTTKRVLRGLAWELRETEAVAWTDPELSRAIWDVRSQHEDLDFRLRNTWSDNDAFLNELATRSGVLAPQDESRSTWAFLHRQFREFLAAQAIRDRVAGGKAWQDEIAELTADSIPRWSETLGFYCGMAEAPLEVLEFLRDVNIPAAVRALDDVHGVDFETLLEFLFSTPVDERVVTPDWDGDDLRRLVTHCREDGSSGPEAARAALWKRVHPEATTTRLAWIHHALNELEDVDDDRFFDLCGRPRPERSDIEFIEIAGGSFTMGSPDHERGRVETEGLRRQVAVGAFAMAKTAVTKEQYHSFDPQHGPAAVEDSELARHPVCDVSWWQAYLFCAWMGARLPSEAEWEYACRAGTSTAFSFGDEISCDEVNFGSKGAVEVGSLPANAFGLHEMHGNIWEWCADEVGFDSLGSMITRRGIPNPTRILRGGCWFSVWSRVRSAYRGAREKGLNDDRVGFRVAKAVPPGSVVRPADR